jgi:tetratricopeptide (TPR) repeat protein
MDLTNQLHAALVIEQPNLAQSHLKYSLNQMGFEHIDLVDRSQQAISALISTQYDLVLCAYDLNKGADGYQLFEQIAKERLISSSTTFVFMSSENNLPLSQSVIELKPDDFILKPFNTSQLELRLKRILYKKLTLKKVFKYIDSERYQQAIEELNTHISNNTHPRWIPYLMKLKGEIILAMDQWQIGEAYFEKVRTLQPYPWASLGLVECQMQLDKFSQAEVLLHQLIADGKTRLPALDLLSKVYEKNNQFESALNNLKSAIQLAPRNIERQQELLNLARINQDFETQYEAANSIIRHVRHSIHDCPEIYLSAVRSAIDYGFTLFNEEELTKLRKNSETILTSVKKNFPGAPINDQLEVAQVRLLNLANERVRATELMKANRERTGKYKVVDIEDALDKAKAFHELGFHRDSEKMFNEINELCEQGGQNPVLSQYIKNESKLRIEIKDTPKVLNNRAVELFQRGRLKEALEEFKKAFKVMPKNPSIALNLMQTLIDSNALVEHEEESKLVLHLCLQALRNAQLNEEQSERMEKLQAKLHETENTSTNKN